MTGKFNSGRKVGRQNVSMDQIEIIVKLSEEGNFRGDIADKVGLSKMTVWKYQKRFDLV